ncbi:hypothetical protein UFOVP45_120 [uncultured Caudovirales phage]|uniref:Uncharacterized protein n=1 Tax=uncultured Caudovirales phage TaxID=2100421 RepID=A0A6J5KVG0_9CAUD|nr:hypothetical protein UFOVP45_120 [uncultured Caudovirales phage]
MVSLSWRLVAPVWVVFVYDVLWALATVQAELRLVWAGVLGHVTESTILTDLVLPVVTKSLLWVVCLGHG